MARLSQPDARASAVFVDELDAGRFQGARPNRASRTTEWIGQEPAEHKSFAADVVAAMSNPADERVTQLLSLGSQRRTASAD
jgi:hypothetical protein